MKKIFSFSLLLILGLVASQILPGMLGEGYPAFRPTLIMMNDRQT